LRTQSSWKERREPRMEKPPIALRIVFLGKHLGHLIDHRMARRGLNRTQTTILTVLDRRPGLQALDLCRPAGVEPANVTRTIQSLERLGLLERRPHPTDRRAHLLFLTEAGHSLARELSEEVREISADLLRQIPPELQPQTELLLDSLWKAVTHQISDLSRQKPLAHGEVGCVGRGNAGGDASGPHHPEPGAGAWRSADQAGPMDQSRLPKDGTLE
jgi:MarR family transcriptional regulator for hemolysin